MLECRPVRLRPRAIVRDVWALVGVSRDVVFVGVVGVVNGRIDGFRLQGSKCVCFPLGRRIGGLWGKGLCDVGCWPWTMLCVIVLEDLITTVRSVRLWEGEAR